MILKGKNIAHGTVNRKPQKRWPDYLSLLEFVLVRIAGFGLNLVDLGLYIVLTDVTMPSIGVAEQSGGPSNGKQLFVVTPLGMQSDIQK